jgi:hypothetical protein
LQKDKHSKINKSNKMRTMKQINQVAFVTIVATLMFTASCRKPDQPAISPWMKKATGVTTPQRGIVEMSTYGQTTCYGINVDFLEGSPLHDITYTHDGGATWRTKAIAGLEDNYLFGVAATTENTVHAVGYNYKSGGGNVFRSTDGGNTWQKEAANAFKDAASFPDDIKS